jgi:hypothetical protein
MTRSFLRKLLADYSRALDHLPDDHPHRHVSLPRLQLPEPDAQPNLTLDPKVSNR